MEFLLLEAKGSNAELCLVGSVFFQYPDTPVPGDVQARSLEAVERKRRSSQDPFFRLWKSHLTPCSWTNYCIKSRSP